MIAAHAVRAARDLAYLTIALVTSTLAFCVWVGGLSIAVSFAIFIVGLPVLVAVAAVCRWTAELDRRNAAWMVGHEVRGHYRQRTKPGLMGRVSTLAGDPQTWRDLVWLVAHSILGFVLGCIALTLTAAVLSMATLPAWYWALPDDGDYMPWGVDGLAGALVATALAIPLAVVTVVLVRLMAAGHSTLAVVLLSGEAQPAGDDAAAAGPQTRAAGDEGAPPAFGGSAPDPETAFALHVCLSALAALVTGVIWAATGLGYFWPVWVWLGLAVAVAIHVLVRRALRMAPGRERNVRVHAEASALVVALLLVLWALAGGGYFWPLWPALGLGILLAVHWLVAYRDVLGREHERELEERVDTLERTRRGALDVQAAELRRIERDLHDGAQARLVALSMLAGRAEEQLGDRPEVAALVRQAREEAAAAIRELRDLARGIAPPVLADRGLGAAVQALAGRAPMPVDVELDSDDRPPPVVETAAYFVVAEALTNVAKHGDGAGAHVALQRDDGTLVVEVSDDGPGGADPSGGGLTGLRRRVEALDGTVRVTSPPGGGTTIRAELPCAS